MDVARADVFGRYALPGNRYKKLLGASFMDMAQLDRLEFGRSMAVDAKNAALEDLDALLRGDWREQTTDAWLAGLDKRIQLRARISELLLGGGHRYAGKGHAFALARFGTIADAQVLLEYLNRNLRNPEHRGEQPWALGALLMLDRMLGSSLGAELVSEGGLWSRWAAELGSPLALPEEAHRVVKEWCTFAEECNVLVCG